MYSNIGVMCGSSSACPAKYLEMAYNLGRELGKNGYNVVYGGGAKGLMRQVADGNLDAGGEVIGVIPKFMIEVEWQHPHLSDLIKTETMDERINIMKEKSEATLFLPGGSGTMEELFTWLVAKRLGHYRGPLIVFNLDGYYDPLKDLLANMEREKFHTPYHTQMVTFVKSIEETIQALQTIHPWDENAIEHAAVK